MQYRLGAASAESTRVTKSDRNRESCGASLVKLAVWQTRRAPHQATRATAARQVLPYKDLCYCPTP
jgi:hypothetical protein